jgi:hypothetical protein
MFRFGFADPATTQHAAEPGPAEQDQGAAAGAPLDTVGAEEVLDCEVRAMTPATVPPGVPVGRRVGTNLRWQQVSSGTVHHLLLAGR